MASFSAARVIAFHKGKAVVTAPENWRVRFADGQRSVKLGFRGVKLSYSLGSEALCVAPVGQRDHVAVGRTLGRITFTGIAGSLLLAGRARVLGGAVTDLALRGASRNTVVEVCLIMRDTTTVWLQCSPKEWNRIQEKLPVEITDPAAALRAAETVKAVDRMVADGGRVLAENPETERRLLAVIHAAQGEAKYGATFELRDSARMRAQELDADLRQHRNMHKAVEYFLAAGDRKRRTHRRIAFMLRLGFISFMGTVLMVWIANH